ncbi:MAG: M48 family metallopeptidase [Imperialibacter sp.]|uniref:M48 family metallopeptidase n=1 Tax=Imperialibacter sp. TaxID=2038411 RepID=UPI0032EE7B99
MKRSISFIVLILSLVVYSCSTVAVTGRKQLALVPDSELNSMSFTQYDQVLNESKLSTNTAQVNQVKSVGLKIQKAVESYMATNGLSDQLKGYKWEFNLIQDDETVNAWCMPGGKVAFYTAIMPICKTDEGVAVVMGHEIAHAIARHGNERMTQGLIQQFGGLALSYAVKDKPAEAQQLFMTAYGAGTTVGAMLPFSRLQESEADKMGLIFMAMAGYNPNEAPAFWERMAANSGGGAPPEFLSTHPSHGTRIADLKAQIPEAMKYYKK